jgi:hypothetical protein
MASDKTTHTASGIGTRTPLGIKGEVGGEGSETHLPRTSRDATRTSPSSSQSNRLIEVLTRSLENQRLIGGRPQDRMGEFLKLKLPTFVGPANRLMLMIGCA